MAGVYISYPFCAQKCTYCNFASGVFPRKLEARYLATLRDELQGTIWSWQPETVYLGGGTPSQIEPDAFRSLLECIPGKPWREATLEAAPGSITEAKAQAWYESGINRVSLGVQSFVPKELARTGRKHNAQMVQNDVQTLRRSGLTNISVDLIAGLPGQTRESWRESIQWVLDLDVPHVSVYMLEVDEDSRLGSEILSFGQRYGAADVPADDLVVEFYENAVDSLRESGINRYEISNFARPGFESFHNLKYWRREAYLGFGADAHSFDGTLRWQNVENAADYVNGPHVPERIPADAIGEPLYLGLRLSEGYSGDWSRFAPIIDRFVDDGLLERAGKTIRLTPRGILLSNELFAEFTTTGLRHD